MEKTGQCAKGEGSSSLLGKHLLCHCYVTNIFLVYTLASGLPTSTENTGATFVKVSSISHT